MEQCWAMDILRKIKNTPVVLVVGDDERIIEASVELPGWGRETLLSARLGDVIQNSGEGHVLPTLIGRSVVNVARRPLPNGMQFVEITES